MNILRKGVMRFFQDPLLEYFLYKHRAEIRRDLESYPEHIRMLETFPNDQIMDFLELLNSNIAIALLTKYSTDILGLIAKEVDADSLKVEAEAFAGEGKGKVIEE